MITKTINIKSQEQLADIFGPYDGNIRNIMKTFGVSVKVRNNRLEVRGSQEGVRGALSVLEDAAESNKIRETAAKTLRQDGEIYRSSKGIVIRANSTAQKKYAESMRKNPVTIAMGPAGTGKTFLAVACGLSFIEEGKFSKIILSRPVVEAGEKLGFLPGDFEEKVCPYLAPLYDAFTALMGLRSFERFKEQKLIEIVPLAYMRGRTLDKAFIILDEAQNTTSGQMKMILTRLGPDGVIVVNGDETQIDLKEKVDSGLLEVSRILRGIRGINFIRFTLKDVVRHPLVKKIVRAYGENGENR